MFGRLFGRRKASSLEDISDLADPSGEVKRVVAKARSLASLARHTEARQAFQRAEAIAIEAGTRSSGRKHSKLLQAFVLMEANDVERATNILRELKADFGAELTEVEANVIDGLLLKQSRENRANEGDVQHALGFTTVFCCQNCGRLHNYITLPCPSCEWVPNSRVTIAKGVILSNLHIQVPALLVLSRQMATGRAPREVVKDLDNSCQQYLESPAGEKAVALLEHLISEEAGEPRRRIVDVRQCEMCRDNVLYSADAHCKRCGGEIRWNDRRRMMLCIDSLLALCEQRVEIRSPDQLAEFVCILVSILNGLLRKQELPSPTTCRYLLQVASRMTAIADKNLGAVIETSKAPEIKVHFIRDRMDDDSVESGTWLAQELDYLFKTADRLAAE